MEQLRTIGVIGAGVMGAGLAQALAQSEHELVLLDLSNDVLERARAEIVNGVRLHGMLSKGQTKQSPKDVVARIQFTCDYEALRGADFVIENVTEKWVIKESVWRQLDAVCPPHCVLAANTSAISITRIGSLTRRPENVLGMHFMNPVPLKPTVEVIRAFHTSDATVQTAMRLLSQMGKHGVLVSDSPGFVSNRVLMLTINEAVFLVAEGVASHDDVDRIFKECFGHKMGPLETADLIGLDTILLSIEVLYESYNDSKYRPCPLLKKMVDAGLYGRKSGRGFYSY
jgi:3-hydroxybutyryl-CoA dehydrogenase